MYPDASIQMGVAFPVISICTSVALKCRVAALAIAVVAVAATASSCAF